VQEHIPHERVLNVLMVGCGNSSNLYLELSEKMQEYLVTNIDISNVVVDQMVQKSTQDYLLMDACSMGFKSRCFDCVFDKGTFDALAVIHN